LGGSWSVGFEINASGQVAGESMNAAGKGHAFRTSATGSISDPGTDLGTLPGGAQSVSYGINALGDVVGASTTTGGVDHAFFDTTQMWDLNDLIQPGTGWVLRRALAINDNDWIAGDAEVNGGIRGFLLIPVADDPGARAPVAGVPEPSSLALTASWVCVWLIRRRPIRRESEAFTVA
jgi:probable HAF family extracellular repeat protein